MSGGWKLLEGDCLDLMAERRESTVDAIVTDPPYGLGFMGKAWDALPPGLPWAEQCLRVLKPGGHLLAFGGTRTSHRLAVALEDAGFEIRDTIAWMYGSGFPKSLNVSKAIDRAAGAKREVVARIPDRWTGAGSVLNFATDRPQESVAVTGGPATPDAERWEGWGTALKPAYEPIIVARKPLAERTVAANVLAHGTGALNIDATRIATTDALGGEAEKITSRDSKGNAGWERPWMDDPSAQAPHAATVTANVAKAEALGRWPANVVLDEYAAAALDEQTGILTSGKPGTIREAVNNGAAFGAESRKAGDSMVGFGDSGGASRFFYVAKPSQAERSAGLDERNAHPTVKPVALMRWLVRLATPPGGIILDPFAGSGSTLIAAVHEGAWAIGMEREAEYAEIARRRITHVHGGPR